MQRGLVLSACFLLAAIALCAVGQQPALRLEKKTPPNGAEQVAASWRGMLDQVRGVLDRRVSLGRQGAVTFEQALAVFRAEGELDVPVRSRCKIAAVDSQGEVLPIGAWFQLFADCNPEVRFLVREHGILVTPRDQVPPEALTIQQLWDVRPAPKRESMKLRVQLRIHGVLAEVETAGLWRTRAEELVRAAVKLYHAGGQLDGYAFETLRKDWEKRLAGDHLLMVLPNRAAFGLAPDSDFLDARGAAEVLIGLRKDLGPEPQVYVRVAQKLDVLRNIPAQHLQAFTAVLLQQPNRQ